MKFLIIFGSGSDEPTFSGIAKALKGKVETRVASAHRTPELVDSIVSKKWTAIIAGAGVAAALPGVVAAKTIRPVFGVPVDAAFGGLDAFLSIVQMPPGIPVITCPPGKDGVSLLAKHVKSIGNLKGVNFIADPSNKRVEKAVDMLTGIGVPVMFGPAAKDAVNIQAANRPKLTKHFTINVPLMEKTRPEDAAKLMKASKGAFWTGVNRVDNAAIAAVQLLNDGRYDKALLKMRKDGKAKVRKDDARAKKRYR